MPFKQAFFSKWFLTASDRLKQYINKRLGRFGQSRALTDAQAVGNTGADGFPIQQLAFDFGRGKRFFKQNL
ncbi:MAG: hypothetical protein RI556_08215 [Hydrogenovibrio sp.]|uniref:hypothetical protein n=1 Tax=Hydrogenovibrio sp. TaxID=2065821 RepID=UPI0028706AB5|nr:hypothetical protein [Hydrogenovibrio sp.]MDR9499144.1 hypothetical protein [Hydrogenovibrio sp.]